MEILNKCTLVIAIAFSLLLISCNKEPDIKDTYLDGKLLIDSSIVNPSAYLLSKAKPNPTNVEKQAHVIITTHGYSSSTFEWKEFSEYVDTLNTTKLIFTSQVLLGGHGTNFDDFKNATWKDWQSSIRNEYTALINAGYENISFLTSSTSGALLIDLLYNNYFNDKVIPKNIFMVDPLVIPRSKTLSLIKIAGPIIGYVVSNNTTAEDPYWYHFRPQESLQQLQSLVLNTKKQLEKGVNLPSTTYLKVYKSTGDDVVNPSSIVLIKKGIKGGHQDYELIDSDIHVYTRLRLRTNVSSKDRQNQIKTFNDIISKL